MLAALYLLSFLDRKYSLSSVVHNLYYDYDSTCSNYLRSGGNIGNAKIEGLQEDLNMTPGQYNWCLTVFFFTYAAFEVPSNLLLKKLRPSRWLPLIMVCWGVVMTLMGLVQSFQGLLVARLFLGVTEAGLFPGVAVSLSFSPLAFFQVSIRFLLSELTRPHLVLSYLVVLPP